MEDSGGCGAGKEAKSMQLIRLVLSG